ncbi:FHA domain-containing protein [Sinomonas mesophila]|uniref:FHA domain-containing protein n=1 Tax=Sinomonas mesophila TaxID=1531955 RepID=UPI000987C1BE|nr:FHA domain-containing protein [Sinomonas mesophila]
MATREYCPGTRWTLVARGHLAVLLPVEHGRPLVPRLWALLGDGTDLYGVLDALTAEFGFARLPAFGIAEHRERLRLLVRGAVDAAVTTPAGRERVSGADVGTWLERGVDGWTAVELVGEDDGGPSLPLEGGAVGAASVRVHSGNGAAPMPAAEPATAAAPAPTAAPAQTEAPAAAPARESAAGEPAAGEQGSLDATILPPTDTQLPADEAPLPAAEPPAEAAPAAAPAEDHPTTTTSSYDQLWGSTVVRSVEDAAVRESEAEEHDGPGPEQTTDPLPPPRTTEPLAQPAAAPPASPALAWTPPSLLIDSLPWAGPAPEPAGPGRDRESPQAPERGPEDRSITSELFGDHDGETVMRSDLDGLEDQPADRGATGDLGLTVPPPAGDDAGADRRGAPPSPADRREGPLVLGRRCPRGHANPPSYAQCPACGEPITGEPEQLPRPALGRVRFSSGEVIELEEPLVVGRQPSVSRVASGGMPRLVTVASPSGDISRNHLEVRLEGWHVMLRDLKATNGTVLERPGQSPRRLAQGEMSIVLDGDVADLGDGVTLTFEAVP